jgi:molecular chaperone GrpE (heat shock protein)
MKKFNEFIKEKNITESNGFSRTPQINLKRNFPTPEEVEEEEKLKEKPKPLSTEDMLRKKLEASEQERKGLEAEIDHYHKKAPLERESAVKRELEKIENSIVLEVNAMNEMTKSTTSICDKAEKIKICWEILAKKLPTFRQ